MFTKQHLEAIQDMLDGATLDAAMVKELQGEVHTALWNLTRPVPRKDADLIAQAIADGRLQVFKPPIPGEPESVTRLRPKAVVAKDGDELLAALGL